MQNIEQIRKTLKENGYLLRKGRGTVSPNNLGGYMIIDGRINGVVAGSDFELTLEDVVEWMESMKIL
ncbi:MAG: hypothetical protein IKF59_05935 [Lachnospiraceae bacterium]|nr:hypothetical protein [Lachnospiraceae bacterium]